MKTASKQENEKLESNGKGDLQKVRCKCSDDCRCPNSKFKEKVKNKFVPVILKKTPPVTQPSIVKTKKTPPDDPCGKCPCGEKNKSKKYPRPCSNDQDCTCTLPTHPLSLRDKITDLDNAIKTHGRGKKRKSGNVQTKSIQISEVFRDPDTKQKSIVTLSEKSKVKVQIRTFSDDTRKLEKNKKQKKQKSTDRSSKSTKSSKSSKSSKSKGPKPPKPKKDKKTKVKKQKKEKKPKKKKTERRICGCFGKKAKEPKKKKSKSKVQTVLYESEPCKNGPCLGIKAFSKTEKGGEGIVNTNTVIFPEKFVDQLNQGACDNCKILSQQLEKQSKDIQNVQKSIVECINLLRKEGQTVYMLSEMANPVLPHNYCNAYTCEGSTTPRKKSAKDGKISDNTYDPDNKVRDWISHGNLKQKGLPERAENGKLPVDKRVKRTSKERELNREKHKRSKASAQKSIKVPDKFDAELDDYLNICSQEYQVYRQAKVKKEKKQKKSKKASEETSPTPSYCDRIPEACQCGPECVPLGVQTSTLTVDTASKDKKEELKRIELKESKDKKKAKKEKKKKGKSGEVDETSGTENSKDAEVLEKAPEKAKEVKPIEKKKIRTGCMGRFLRCILCGY